MMQFSLAEGSEAAELDEECSPNSR